MIVDVFGIEGVLRIADRRETIRDYDVCVDKTMSSRS